MDMILQLFRKTARYFSETIEEELDHELIIKSLTAAPGFFMCAAWITYNRLETVTHRNIIFLLGIVLMLLAVIRFLLGHLHKKNYLKLSVAVRLVKINIILNGVLWSVATFLPILEFQFNNITSAIQVIALILGLTLSSLITLAYSLRLAYAYQWIMTLPSCLYLFFLAFTENNSTALNAGSIILIGIIYMLQQTREVNKQILKSLHSALDLKNSNIQLKKVEKKLKLLNEDLESKVAERTLELSEAKLNAENSNHAKSEFLANMSHEIRTPLGAVMGFADLVANDEITSSEKQNYLAAIKRNGDLLSNIISDILDLSKIEVGKLNIECHDVLLEDILSDSKTLLNLIAGEKGISLDFAMEEPLPKKINTDPLRLRQILLNIVGNSIKFTEHGSVVVTIKQVPRSGRHPQLAFVVKDTGIGISNEQATKLFKSFSQADNSLVRKFGGTGLGLVLSKRLAILLGGDVVLTESEIGKGSMFTVTVDPGPFQVSESVEVRSRKRSGPVLPDGGLKVTLENVNVLIVDDSVDNQYLIGKILNLAGAKIDTAINGKIALEKAGARKYDIFILDLQMPVMDGYETAIQLRKMGIKKPIIALTAYALKEVRQRCLDSGFDDFITKPINRGLLLEKIAHYFGKSRPRVSELESGQL